MLDLDEKYVSIIKKILAEQIPDQTVWAYGSRVKGQAHPGSDLDLVIIPTNKALETSQLYALREAFSESNLPILIDILDWDSIPDNFKAEIKKIHEVLQEPSIQIASRTIRK
jgi:predicted nucleotidyltransferase